MTVESMMWTARLKRCKGARRRPPAKPGERLPRCSNIFQKSCSAISAGRTLLAWERPLRLGGRGAANRAERARVQAQSVANVVEAQGMSQLGKEHRHDMTPRGVGTSFVVDTAFAAQLR